MAQPQFPSPWFDFCRTTTEISVLATQVLTLWAPRYPVIVINSARGEQCPWALQALRLAQGQQSELVQVVTRLRDLCNQILAEAPTAHSEADAYLETLL